jgi:hypothetical protein
VGRFSSALDTAEEPRCAKWCKDRRILANFENLPITTHVYELTEAVPAPAVA